MKRFFSEFKYHKALRKLGTNDWDKSEQATEFWFQNAARLAQENPSLCYGGSKEPQYAHALACFTQLQLLSKGGTHYFIQTPELAILIESIAKDFTCDVLDVFHENRSTAFVIHPPTPRPAVLVGIRTIDSGTTAIFQAGSCVDEEPCFCLTARSFANAVRLKPQGYADRLAVGLALYIRFFPHAVVDGIPENAKHPNHYKGQHCATIGVAEELIDRSGPKPHIRKFHLRFLGSDKFTHKQGQLVPVKAAFIRGVCKLVVEVESSTNK